jgi:DNA-directed RNA polymerase subunit RPC12/RpoP
MSENLYSCGKCGAGMVRGFAADRGDSSSVFNTMWIDGEPIRATLLGITGDNLKLGDAKRRMIRGLRCERCGYLELYAV